MLMQSFYRGGGILPVEFPVKSQTPAAFTAEELAELRALPKRERQRRASELKAKYRKAGR